MSIQVILNVIFVVILKILIILKSTTKSRLSTSDNRGGENMDEEMKIAAKILRESIDKCGSRSHVVLTKEDYRLAVEEDLL